MGKSNCFGVSNKIYVAKLVKCIVVVAFVFVLGSASISVWALFFDVF